MRFVPTERFEIERRRRLLKYFPSWIGNFRPVPSGPYAERCRLLAREERHEVDSEPEIVGAVTGTRFRNTFGEQVVLPVETAKRLEDIEAVLHETGLMAPHHSLVQLYSNRAKFVVKAVKAAIPHCRSPAPASEQMKRRASSPFERERRVWILRFRKGRKAIF